MTNGTKIYIFWQYKNNTIYNRYQSLLYFRYNINKVIVSEGLLFNANSAIFQLYHGKKKLIFNEMMRFALF